MLRGTGISTHVPRTGHDAQNKPFFFFADWISIHAPLTGRDQRQREEAGGADGISIHVPRTGHDRKFADRVAYRMKFQSTCPVRGTTSGI